MKAKKDGKLTTSPDPYGIEDMSVTKLGMPEYVDTRQMTSLGYSNYNMSNGTAVNMGHAPGNISQNCMMPTYGGMIPKM